MQSIISPEIILILLTNKLLKYFLKLKLMLTKITHHNMDPEKIPRTNILE